MGKNNKKRRGRSVVRRSNRAPKKKARISARAAEKARDREIRTARIRDERDKELSGYIIIRSDDERPVPSPAADAKKEEVLSERLKRISLKEIQRYAKTAAAAYDRAFVDIGKLRKEIEDADSELSGLRAPRNASDDERKALSEKRKDLRKRRAELDKRLMIAEANATALERSSDEYAYIIALLTGIEPSYKKMPRLKDKRIDLTEEEKADIIERYLGRVKDKTAVQSEAKTPESQIRTLKVLGSADGCSDGKACEDEKERDMTDRSGKKTGRSMKWIIWPVIAAAVIAAAITLKLTLKDSSKSPDNAVEAPAAAVVPAVAEVEEAPVAITEETDTEAVTDGEPEADDAVVYEDVIDIDGISIKVRLEDSSAQIEYPEDVISRSDIDSFFGMLADKYPEYLMSASYSAADGIIDVSTPYVLTDGDKEMVMNLFRSELTEYASLISQPYEYNDSFILYDAEISLCIGRSSASVSYPEYVTDDDVLAFISYAAGKYPELTGFVTYSIGEGETSFSIPFELTDDEVRAVSDAFGDELIEYLASVFENDTEGSEAPVEPETEEPQVVEPAPVSAQETLLIPQEKEALEEPSDAIQAAVAAPAVTEEDSVISNGYRTSLYFRAGASFLTGPEPGAYQNYAIGADFSNIIRAGSRFGFGLRLEGSMDAIPYRGDYGNINSASAFFSYENWMRMYMLDCKVMAEYSAGPYSIHAGAGIGYALANPQLGSYSSRFGYTLCDISTTLSSAWALTATAGADFRLSDRFYLALECGYKHLLPASRGYVTAGVSMGISF